MLGSNRALNAWHFGGKAKASYNLFDNSANPSSSELCSAQCFEIRVFRIPAASMQKLWGSNTFSTLKMALMCLHCQSCLHCLAQKKQAKMARQLIHGSVIAACVAHGWLQNQAGTEQQWHELEPLCVLPQLTCVKNASCNQFQVDKFTEAEWLNSLNHQDALSKQLRIPKVVCDN